MGLEAGADAAETAEEGEGCSGEFGVEAGADDAGGADEAGTAEDAGVWGGATHLVQIVRVLVILTVETLV